VKAGHVAAYVLWVWSVKATSDGTSVRASLATTKNVDAPKFAVCPVPASKICKLGNLPTGRVDELEVGVHVLAKAALGEKLRLTAKVSAKRSHSDSASASYVVVRTPKVTATTPPPTLPTASLPPIPNSSTSPSNPAGLFPTVSTSTSPPTTGTRSLPRVKPHSVRAATASATVPLDARLIGGQLAGLAVLAGGIAIALIRLSLRRQRVSDGNDQSGPPQ
jgi:hypothetical protein